eukprot:g10642.t1
MDPVTARASPLHQATPQPHRPAFLARRKLRNAAFDVVLGMPTPGLRTSASRADYVLQKDTHELPPLATFLVDDVSDSLGGLPSLHVALNDAVAAFSLRVQFCVAERLDAVNWTGLRPGASREAAFESMVAAPCRNFLGRMAAEWGVELAAGLSEEAREGTSGQQSDRSALSRCDRSEEAVALLRSHLERALQGAQECVDELTYAEPIIFTLPGDFVGSGTSVPAPRTPPEEALRTRMEVEGGGARRAVFDQGQGSTIRTSSYSASEARSCADTTTPPSRVCCGGPWVTANPYTSTDDRSCIWRGRCGRIWRCAGSLRQHLERALRGALQCVDELGYANPILYPT